ncbi:hypothetical protein T01_859 [Trichinella spiralis]|uniref:Uncharacterized protein n=1 Tax=Trichinella spiralis TaxID=6334 RepID=A0A0V1B859_TRISP|nr:hypothetical protein T01_859 [Trichinella spiralis]
MATLEIELWCHLPLYRRTQCHNVGIHLQFLHKILCSYDCYNFVLYFRLNFGAIYLYTVEPNVTTSAFTCSFFTKFSVAMIATTSLNFGAIYLYTVEPNVTTSAFTCSFFTKFSVAMIATTSFCIPGDL